MRSHVDDPLRPQRIEPLEEITVAEAARRARANRHILMTAGMLATWIVVHVAGWL